MDVLNTKVPECALSAGDVYTIILRMEAGLVRKFAIAKFLHQGLRGSLHFDCHIAGEAMRVAIQPRKWIAMRDDGRANRLDLWVL